MPLFKRTTQQGAEQQGAPQVPASRPESFITFPLFPPEQMKIGQLGTGFDEDPALGATEEAWGGEAGGAGVATRDASGDGTPGPLYAKHVGDMREGEAEERAEAKRARLEREVGQASPKADLARAKADALRQQIDDVKPRLEASRTKQETLRTKVDAAEDRHRELPRSEQGIVNHWALPLVIAVAVSVIDVGVLHLAFAFSRVGTVDIWLNAIAIPVAMLGMMIAFGWLAGLIALAVPHRYRLLVGILSLGLALLTVFLGIALLTHFRDVAVDARNHRFDLIKSGGSSLSGLTQVVKTTFLGALQAAAVWAGVIAEALYVMGKPGRDARAEAARARKRWKRATRELADLEDAVEGLAAQERAARIEAERALMEGAGFAAELRSLDDCLAATRKAIRGAVSAAADRYEMERLIAAQKARNGSVRLASRESTLLGRTWVTPGPLFVNGTPPPPPSEPPTDSEAPSTNGDS